ncbi:MAG: hypothetical protein ABIL58_22635 [Pseudomonadota bacterium]
MAILANGTIYHSKVERRRGVSFFDAAEISPLMITPAQIHDKIV